jgi:hypothetical protein
MLDSRPISETARIHYVFKDLRTFLRIFGRLSDVLAQTFEANFDFTSTMLNRFLEIIQVTFSVFSNYQDFGDFPKL